MEGEASSENEITIPNQTGMKWYAFTVWKLYYF